MSRRLTTEIRRGQIARATLTLLANTPVDRITTRQVARELGISQPALFRHFRSRDEIFAAVVAHTRSELEGLAAEILHRKSAPLESLAALMRGLAAYAVENPGMPRLLFDDLGRGESSKYHQPLAQLVGLQRSLVAELVRQAQQAGDANAAADPDAAATLLVATLQGLLLRWQWSGRTAPLARDIEAMLSAWVAALQAGTPATDGVMEPAEPSVPGAATPALLALDVRPLLAAGDEPLDEILAQLRRLLPDGVLKLLAPFRPTPLLGLLAARDYRVEVREFAADCWGVEVLGSDAPVIEDLCGLPAPEPLERILAATADLAAGACYAARTPRHPHLLLPHLEERGLCYQVHDEPDGTALIHVRRPL